MGSREHNNSNYNISSNNSNSGYILSSNWLEEHFFDSRNVLYIEMYSLVYLAVQKHLQLTPYIASRAISGTKILLFTLVS